MQVHLALTDWVGRGFFQLAFDGQQNIYNFTLINIEYQDPRVIYIIP